jgi:hypothetical protein
VKELGNLSVSGEFIVPRKRKELGKLLSSPTSFTRLALTQIRGSLLVLHAETQEGKKRPVKQRTPKQFHNPWVRTFDYFCSSVEGGSEAAGFDGVFFAVPSF